MFSKKLTITFVLSLTTFLSYSQITKYSDWQTTVEHAENSDKHILIILTGLDWCKPCIKLEKNVIEQNEFIEFAVDNLVIFEINLPNHQNINSQIYKDYKYFRDKYQTNALPTLILTDTKGIEKTRITNGLSSVDNVIKRLKEKL